MAELLDTVETAGYLLGFWGFVFSSKYRAQVLARWRTADAAKRGRLALDGIIATIVGLGLPGLIIWILLT